MKIVLGPNQPIPEYKTKEAAAFDLYATESVILYPNKIHVMDMEFAMQLPTGLAAKLLVRSSIGRRGVMLANTEGLIDNDFTSSVLAMLTTWKSEPVKIQKGERILQVQLIPYIQGEFEPVKELPSTIRGQGLGSTGRF